MNAQQSVLVDHDARYRANEAISIRQEKLPEDALRLLAEEVITRLASRFTAPAVANSEAPSDKALDALADALISPDPDAGLEHVMDLQAHGVDRDTIYLSYLAGAARRLGERWDDDILPFTIVTIGASRLYIILRALRPVFVSGGFNPKSERVALFGSAPGEDHVLGVTMAADMFRERGWSIDLRTGMSHDELVDIASTRLYPVIGLSAGSRRMVVPLTRLIASLRVVNPASQILVSGELTMLEDDLGKIVDADFIAHNAPEAIAQMQRLAEELSPARAH